MSYSKPPDHIIKELLTSATTIAIVGASSKPDRASYGIMQRLQQVGYRVIPVNPNESEVLGERAYASLTDIAEPIDIVDVFRRAEYTPAIADEAVKIGAKALWLQSGVFNEEAAARAKTGGLLVVMDACLGTMHSVLRVKREPTTSRSPLRAG
jgi:predicted CoA-binding protein